MIGKIFATFIVFVMLTFCSIAQQNNIVKDYDGNVYHSVKIGEQVWLKENLKVTHYNDGSPILIMDDDNIWSTTKEGAYCLPHENPEEYKNTYGILYNYYVIADDRGICPEGWRIPTKEDWLQLEEYLGGKDIAGGKLKSNDKEVWAEVYSGKVSGFNALPAGGRGRVGGIGEVGNYATWWTSTDEDENFTWHWGVHPNKNSTRRNPGHNNSGFSIRLIKVQ